MRIWENPPRKKRRKGRRARRNRRGPNGRFLSRKRRSRRKAARHIRRPGGSSMARRRRRKSSKRSRAAKKAARTRKRNKSRRAAQARKNFRKGRRRRRSTRSAAPRRRRRKSRGRARRRRRSGKVFRPVLRRRKRRWYAAPGSKIKGRRINPRRRRRRRNPFGLKLGGLIPTSFGQVKSFAVLGAGGAVGFLGVSMVNSFMDRFGVAGLKARIANPILGSIVNAVQSMVSTFLLAGAAKALLRNAHDFNRGVFAGGAAKAATDVITPLLGRFAGQGGAAGAVADAALSGYQEQLSGYQYAGVGGFQTTGMGAISPAMTRIAMMNYEQDPSLG